VLFPHAQRLQEALRQKATQAVSPDSSEWSPRTVPYKMYEKSSSADDSDDDDDDDVDDEKAVKAQAAEADADDGLEVGMEEVGFRYSGPEPTAYGDWAHKGRCTDF
ncbi:unnamed protein product, partial [Polarella glacialis]